MSNIHRRDLLSGSIGFAAAAPLLVPAQAVAQTAGGAARTLTDFGGRAATDNSAAAAAALAALGQDGGPLLVPIGEWPANIRVNQDNILFAGQGGVAERGRGGVNCVRPQQTDGAAATVTFGDGTRMVEKGGIDNLVISGMSASGAEARTALLLRGGVSHFSARDFELCHGLRSLAIEPSGAHPVTCNWFTNFHIRGTGNPSRDSRAIYVSRPNSEPNYYTANSFANGHINGPTNGYAVEANAGNGAGILLSFTNVYCDVRPGLGMLFRGNVKLSCMNLQLDPDATGAVVIDTDNPPGTDPARFISGNLVHGGQRIRYRDGSTVLLPEEAEWFFYNARLKNPFLSDLIYLSPSSAPFRTSTYLDFQSDDGPWRLHGLDFRVMSATEAGEPSAAIAGAIMTEGGIAAKKDVWSGGALRFGTALFHGTQQVVGPRQAAVRSPAGGATRDVEARAAIDALIARLRAHGLIA